MYALGSDGVQPAHLLSHLLRLELVKQVVGGDMVFDLKGLLNEQLGSNLRNLDAHGLLDDREYNSTTVPYFWWLTLRLCVVFAIAARSEVVGF